MKTSNKFLKNLTFALAYLFLTVGVICLVYGAWSQESLVLATGIGLCMLGVLVFIVLDWFSGPIGLDDTCWFVKSPTLQQYTVRSAIEIYPEVIGKYITMYKFSDEVLDRLNEKLQHS